MIDGNSAPHRTGESGSTTQKADLPMDILKKRYTHTFRGLSEHESPCLNCPVEIFVDFVEQLGKEGKKGGVSDG